MAAPPLCEQVIASVVLLAKREPLFHRHQLTALLKQSLNGSAQGMEFWVDHILSLMVHRALISRLHLAPGELAYRATSDLDDYQSRMDDLLTPPCARNEIYAEQARQRRLRRKAECETTTTT